MTATKSATTTSNAIAPSKAARRATLATPSAPLARAALFGAPPLFAGEDGAAYEELLARRRRREARRRD